jgi:hypothetical protein
MVSETKAKPANAVGSIGCGEAAKTNGRIPWSTLAEPLAPRFIDMAARRSLKTVAVIYEDTLFTKTAAQGVIELARKKGLQIVLVEAYPKGTADFAGILAQVRAANPDVMAAGTYLLRRCGGLHPTAQRAEREPEDVRVTIGGALPRFYEALGRTTEFVYANSMWEAEPVTLRAGGLIPIARHIRGPGSSSRPLPTTLSWRRRTTFGSLRPP